MTTRITAPLDHVSVTEESRRPRIIKAPTLSTAVFGGWGPRVRIGIALGFAFGTAFGGVGQARATTNAASSAGRCAIQNAPAAIVEKAAFDEPEVLRLEGVTGTVWIAVDLTADGRPAGEVVATSSGNSQLDRRALHVASRTTYKREVRDCNRVPGTYLLGVDFLD